jgi:hypothetical protein
MTEQIEGQATEKQPAVEKKPGFDELFSKGWDTIEADEVAAGGDKPVEKTPFQKLEADCPDCPGGKFYKVIKHNGKDVGIKTEKEYNDYVQQGFDYTKKTQALAEERRKLEAEKETGKSEMQKLMDRLDRMERGSATQDKGDNGKAKPAAEATEAQPQTEAQVFEEWGLDPEYASDFEKKLVKNAVDTKNENKALKELTQLMFLKEMTKNISGALGDAAKEYPVEDVLDEKGESVTAQQVISAFKNLVMDPTNQKAPVRDLAMSAVRQVHEAQQRAKGAVESVDEEMSPEEFAKMHPKLHAKILKAGGREAVADFLETQDGLPPTVESRKTDVSAIDRNRQGKPKFSGLSDAIDRGMDDPEIEALFNQARR